MKEIGDALVFGLEVFVAAMSLLALVTIIVDGIQWLQGKRKK